MKSRCCYDQNLRAQFPKTMMLFVCFLSIDDSSIHCISVKSKCGVDNETSEKSESEQLPGRSKTVCRESVDLEVCNA